MLDLASRRNTVLPETTTLAAKKSTAGSLKRGPYRAPDEQQHVAKHPRITIDDDGKTMLPLLMAVMIMIASRF